jgi:hypothetical protein
MKLTESSLGRRVVKVEAVVFGLRRGGVYVAGHDEQQAGIVHKHSRAVRQRLAVGQRVRLISGGVRGTAAAVEADAVDRREAVVLRALVCRAGGLGGSGRTDA